LQNNLAYWMLFSQLPRWTTLRKNKLVIEILHTKGISFEDFFKLTTEEWKNDFNLTANEIEKLEEGKKELPNYSFLIENLLSQGYEMIPINSKDYPKEFKKNLKQKNSPLLIYIKGNKNLFKDKKIAIVGSRKANNKSLDFTKKIALEATKNYECVVSGGAKGVDQKALEESIKSNGHSILVLPQGILTYSSGIKKYYKSIVEGNLLILSVYPPKAGWSAGLAMGRNKYIYGLAEKIFVAETGSTGGTWAGAIEGINSGRSVYVRKSEDGEENANDELILKGGIPIDKEGRILEKATLDSDLVEKIKQILFLENLTLTQLKKKIKFNMSDDELLIYIEKLPFVEIKKTKKFVKIMYKTERIEKTKSPQKKSKKIEENRLF